VDALGASGLVKRFEATTAVDGVDLTLGGGEVRGLLGPNGAGKTTLLRMLFGLIRPDAGTVKLLGRPLEDVGPGALDGVGGFVEEPCFYPYLSGRANLRLLSKLDGRDGGGARARDIDQALDQALARVDLAHRADARVGGYSTGMRQRLGLAAALLRSPRLLLLDEPTSGLDPAGARAVAALVRDLAAGGVAVLLSSHQIGELERVCDSYTMLRAGRVVWDGTAAELEAEAPDCAYALLTGDDARALEIARSLTGVRARPSPAAGLVVAARPDELDALTLALGAASVPIRRLELLVSPLESVYFALTSEADSAAPGAPEPLRLADAVLAGA
jgi:ABC-2 type transport system ATP-binding protein